jgi:nitroreductase/dihydropteridine reductase
MDELTHLHWRYAVKRYDKSKILTPEELHLILESIRLSPTSLGLQSFKVCVIGPDSIHRQALHTILNKQPQALEASHLLIFIAELNIGAEAVQQHAERMSQIRNQDIASLDKFVKGVTGFLQSQSAEERALWSHKQTYIALGIAMAEAARNYIDSTPMEGFDAKALDEYFQFSEKGFSPSVILALGKRDPENDFLCGLAKVRKPHELMFEFE